MQIQIKEIKTAPELITITKREYTHLTQKASLYDDYKAAQRKRGEKLQSLFTPEQRSERARKAINARWAKRNKEVK